MLCSQDSGARSPHNSTPSSPPLITDRLALQRLNLPPWGRRGGRGGVFTPVGDRGKPLGTQILVERTGMLIAQLRLGWCSHAATFESSTVAKPDSRAR